MKFEGRTHANEPGKVTNDPSLSPSFQGRRLNSQSPALFLGERVVRKGRVRGHWFATHVRRDFTFDSCSGVPLVELPRAKPRAPAPLRPAFGGPRLPRIASLWCGSAVRNPSRPCSPLSAFCLLLTAFCFLPSCGYHVAGRGNRLPPDIKTIAVPIFQNQTSTYRIEQRLSAAVTREFIQRTKFRISPQPKGADAVLNGTVKDIRSGVLTFDLNTGRATSLQIQVTADVKLIDLHNHKILFSNSNYVFREEYQVSQSTTALFQEDQPALDRLSRDLARTLVTEILENF